MPIFEYKCRKCSTVFEHLVIPTTTGMATCPKCKSKGKKLEPVISLFSTTNEYATQRQRALVNKASKNIRYEQAQMEKRLAHDD